jgi:hypothetical protein
MRNIDSTPGSRTHKRFVSSGFLIRKLRIAGGFSSFSATCSNTLRIRLCSRIAGLAYGIGQCGWGPLCERLQ